MSSAAPVCSAASGSVWGTFVGAIIIIVIRNSLNLLNVSSNLQKLVIGVVILLAVLADSKSLVSAIVKANKANIPVILVNDTIDEDALAAEGGKVETYVGIHQYEAASLAGRYAAENIPNGNIVYLEGVSGVKALEDRTVRP